MSKPYTPPSSRSHPDPRIGQLPFDRTPHLKVLLGASDLARVLSLGNPAVVTNWRSRSPRFPAERSGGSQPRFDLVEVLEWLRDDGPRGRALPSVSPLVWWGEIARAYVAVARPTATSEQPRPARNTVLALVLLRQRLVATDAPNVERPSPWRRVVECSRDAANPDAEAPNNTASVVSAVLTDAADWVESNDPETVGLLVPYLTLDHRLATYACDLVAALERCADVPVTDLVEMVLALDDDQRRHEPRRTLDAVAEVMVSLARPSQNDVVLDPAMGEGTLLLEFARRVGGAHLAGQEADRDTLAFVRTRCLLEGRRLDAGDAAADTLVDDHHRRLHADVVLLDPPLDQRDSPLLRWLKYGMQHLVAGGRMVVVLPLHELVAVRTARRRPNERVTALLAEWLYAGSVESVMVLPRGARPDVLGPIAIITATNAEQPSAERPTVVVGVEAPRRRGTFSLDEVAPDFRSLLRSGGAAALVGRSIDGVSARACVGNDVFAECMRVAEAAFSERAPFADAVLRSKPDPSWRDRSFSGRPSSGRSAESATFREFDEFAELARRERGSGRSERTERTDDPLLDELLSQLDRLSARDRQDVIAKMLRDLRTFKPPRR